MSMLVRISSGRLFSRVETLDYSTRILLMQKSPNSKQSESDSKYSNSWWHPCLTANQIFAKSHFPLLPLNQHLANTFMTEPNRESYGHFGHVKSDLPDKVVCFIPGCPLSKCIHCIWLCSMIALANVCNTSSTSFLIASSHLCGTLVILSTLFWFNLTSATPTTNTYNLTISKLSSDEHFIYSLSAHSGFASQSVGEPLIDTEGISLSVETLLPSVKLSSTLLWSHPALQGWCVVSLIGSWLQLASVLNGRPMQFKQDTCDQGTCINSYIKFIHFCTAACSQLYTRFPISFLQTTPSSWWSFQGNLSRQPRQISGLSSMYIEVTFLIWSYSNMAGYNIQKKS